MTAGCRTPRAQRRRAANRLREAKEELFNLRFQNATGQLDNIARLGAGPARTSPGSRRCCASARSPRPRPTRTRRTRASRTMADQDRTSAPRTNPRKVREGLVVSTKMDKTVVVAVVDRVQHRRYGKTLQRTRASTRTTRPTTPARATASASPRPARCRARSAGASWKCWSVPDDPAGVAAQGGRQLGRPRGALHQGARRHAAGATRASATSSSPPSRTRFPARR